MTTHRRQPDEEVPSDFRLVEITREPVELHKILKFEGMTASGGQAKLAIASGQVLVNGTPETRKRKKIVAGDTIEFNEDRIRITYVPTGDAGDVSQEEERRLRRSVVADAPEPESQ